MTKRYEDLRSARWMQPDDLRSMGHRSRAMQMGLSPEETITALTLNSAAALDRADTVGSLDPGKKGDLVILEYPSYRFIPYHTGVSVVEKTIKNGTLVFDKAQYEVPYGDNPAG